MNYFDILNVSQNAEDEVIRASYKALAKKYHPDNTELDAETAARKMQEINEAYRVLSDKVATQRYINELQNGKLASKQVERHRTEETWQSQEYANVQGKTSKLNSDDIVRVIIYGVIIISIVCCLAYYGPGLFKDTCSSIWNSIQDVISTF